MESKIFINLPVKDLKVTSTFFEKIGYSFDPQFSDENARCMIISDHIYVMFLVEPFFQSFTGKNIPDSSETAGVILSLNLESREAVDEFIHKCLAVGGRDVSQPQSVDFMYTRSFEDPDGHIWEVFYMDMVKVRMDPKAQPANI